MLLNRKAATAAALAAVASALGPGRRGRPAPGGATEFAVGNGSGSAGVILSHP